MLAEMNRIRARRLNGEKGFTLVELLVVIVIIGILVAIAIPVFLSQRGAAQDRSIESDVRNVLPVLETYYADNNAYPALETTTLFAATASEGKAFDLATGTTPPTGEYVVTVSPGVTITIDVDSSTSPASYVITGTHADRSTEYQYDSTTGTLEETTTP
jgi:type IV pilus assembly protein PilA